MQHIVLRSKPFVRKQNKSKSGIDQLNKIYQRVCRLYQGVYFEILIEPREPGLGLPSKLIINEETIKDPCKVEADIYDSHLRRTEHFVFEQIYQIKKMRNYYQQLVETAKKMLADVRRHFMNRNFEVFLVKIKSKPKVNEIESKPDLDGEIEFISETELELICEQKKKKAIFRPYETLTSEKSSTEIELVSETKLDLKNEQKPKKAIFKPYEMLPNEKSRTEGLKRKESWEGESDKKRCMYEDNPKKLWRCF